MSFEQLGNEVVGSGGTLRVWDIEEALHWVVNDELPKLRDGSGGVGEPASMHPMWRGGAFGSRIENWNRPPGFPAAMGDPDGDAMLIAHVIKTFDVDRLDLSDTLITYKLPGKYDSFALLERARLEVRSTLIAYAGLKKRPPLDEEVSVEPVRSCTGQITVFRMEDHVYEAADGSPVPVRHEVPTKLIRGGTYPEGTYSLLRYSPAAPERALHRAEYAVWWIALEHLARQLEAATVAGPDGKPVRLLERIGLRTPRAPRYPWVEGEAHSPTVRASSRGSTDMAGRRMDLSQERPTARSWPARRPSEVRRIPADQYEPGDKRA